MAEPDDPEERLNAMQKRIDSLREKHLPDDRSRMEHEAFIHATLPCPSCGAEASPGHLAVHETFWGWVFAGFGWQHLWFQPRNGKEEKIMDAGESRAAIACRSCGAVTIVPRERGR